jgi:hypothetical protein
MACPRKGSYTAHRQGGWLTSRIGHGQPALTRSAVSEFPAALDSPGIAPSEREYEGEIVTVTLELDDGSASTIEATGSHPFWVTKGEDLEQRPVVAELHPNGSQITSGGRWTEARWLRLGDQFLTKTGRSATVAGLSIRIERTRVYNLNVNTLHNYAVGKGGVLVHNACTPGRGNMIKRLHKKGWKRLPSKKRYPRTRRFGSPDGGTERRIMPGIPGPPPPGTPARNLGKYNTPWYYRDRPAPGVPWPGWGPAIPLLD